MVIYTARIAMRSQVLLEAPAVAAEVPVVYLPGPTPSLRSPLVFKHSGALITSGYQTASDALDGLEITGPGLYGIPWC